MGGTGVKKELHHRRVPVHRRQGQRRQLAVLTCPLPQICSCGKEHTYSLGVPGLHREIQRGAPSGSRGIHLGTGTQQVCDPSYVAIDCSPCQLIRHVHCLIMPGLQLH